MTRTRLLRRTMPHVERTRRARLSQLLDLFAEDDRLNLYAGELEVRPPGAPTTEGAQEAEPDRQRQSFVY